MSRLTGNRKNVADEVATPAFQKPRRRPRSPPESGDELTGPDRPTQRSTTGTPLVYSGPFKVSCPAELPRRQGNSAATSVRKAFSSACLYVTQS